jgi:hypothetical protein
MLMVRRKILHEISSFFNISYHLLLIILKGLESGKLLKINIYAVNIKGRSESTLLESYTLKAAEKQTGMYIYFGDFVNFN